MSKMLITFLSLSVLCNGLLAIALLDKIDKNISDKQFMSFCMAEGISDKNCKIGRQYKRTR